jgi:NADPH-dependent ferric siderophore reductase
VEEVERLSPRMVRVVLGGEDLRDFGAGRFTDHYVKLLLPPPGAPYRSPFDVDDIRARLPREQWPRTRTYTVRAWDPERTRLTIDFVHHGDDAGIAGPWAASAQAGDRIQFHGPGGGYTPDPAADWHLMIGDASVVPAISESLTRIAPGVPVHVLVEVEGPEEELPLPSPGDLHLTWLHRRDRSGADDDLLLEAVRRRDFPAGAVHAFVHGEASTVRAVRRHLLVDRGLPRDALSVSGYWKRDRDEEGWRAEKAEWSRQAEQDSA